MCQPGRTSPPTPASDGGGSIRKPKPADESKKEGRKEAKAEAILVVLAARGMAVSDEVRAKILACSEPSTLDRWLAKAAVAHAVADVMSES